jgi:hypothetical protein
MRLVEDVFCRPFVWGVSDCCTAACDVFARLHGIDPMAPLRGRYASRAEAMALIRARGGWRAMADALAREAGLTRSGWAVGALGLAAGREGAALVVGLPCGSWAGKIDGGYATSRKVVAAWQA